MAKKRKLLPKRVAGLKVPKRLRKSRLLQGLLGSKLGRQIVADALVAGAGAAATVLLREREQAAEAADAGLRRGKASLALVTEAVESAADAVMRVVTDAARGLLPDEDRRAASAVRPRQPARRGTERGRGPRPGSPKRPAAPAGAAADEALRPHRRRADQAGRGAQGAWRAGPPPPEGGAGDARRRGDPGGPRRGAGADTKARGIRPAGAQECTSPAQPAGAAALPRVSSSARPWPARPWSLCPKHRRRGLATCDR